MSPQPTRRPLLWLAFALGLAGLTIAAFVTITYVSARNTAQRLLAMHPTAVSATVVPALRPALQEPVTPAVSSEPSTAIAPAIPVASPVTDVVPPTPAADGAYQIHEAWSLAMLAGDPDSVAALYSAAALVPGADPALNGPITRTYADLTRAVMAEHAATLGAFVRPEVLGTYAVTADHHVGLTRARFEAGTLCFRSDLAPGPAGWLVAAWEFVEDAECAALAARP